MQEMPGAYVSYATGGDYGPLNALMDIGMAVMNRNKRRGAAKLAAGIGEQVDKATEPQYINIGVPAARNGTDAMKNALADNRAQGDSTP